MNADRVINARGSLTQRQWYSLQGELMRAFCVRNRKGKCLAIGAAPNGSSPGFCLMHAKRYEHDKDLCRAIHLLTGMIPRGVTL